MPRPRPPRARAGFNPLRNDVLRAEDEKLKKDKEKAKAQTKKPTKK